MSSRRCDRWSANCVFVKGPGGLRDAGAKTWRQSGARRAVCLSGERSSKAARKASAVCLIEVILGDVMYCVGGRGVGIALNSLNGVVNPYMVGIWRKIGALFLCLIIMSARRTYLINLSFIFLL